MPGPSRRLPARPSLEHLRKQAKDLLARFREGDAAAQERFRAVSPRLAEPRGSGEAPLAAAQFVLAREYGFVSWAELARHVDTLDHSNRLEAFQRLARDLLAGSEGDRDALQHLSEHFGTSYGLERLMSLVQERLRGVTGGDGRTDEFTLTDAQLLVARQYGFASWAGLEQSLAQPPEDPRAAPRGMSSTPPFYRIDWKSGTIEPRPPLSDRDWDVILDVMKQEGLTGLNAAGQMTDAVLTRISRLGQVTRLDLGGSQRITDEGLLQLAAMPQLQELDLSGWHLRITDRGLEALRQLKQLRRFAMCWPQQVTDLGVANLASCNQLESVNLLGTPTGDGAITALIGKPRLRQLKTGSRVTDAGLALLHQLPVFQHWQGGETKYALMSPDAEPNHLLLDGPFTDQGLRHLLGLDGLFGLSFFWHTSGCTPDGLAVLAELPRLGFLGCEGKLCDDVAMQHIGAIPGLRMLMAQGTVAGDAGFAALSRSRTLEYLWGRECPNLGGRGFTALAGMPSLRGLAVSCRNVADEALSALPRFPALRELMPMDVSDEGFRHVGGCEQLESLWCMYCRDTGDDATAHLGGLSRLRTYYAGKTRITDRSLEILARLQSLEVVHFWEIAGITNAGLARLASLPRLRELSIETSPGVTREALALFPAGVRINYG